jgi:hypothetical protein
VAGNLSLSPDRLKQVCLAIQVAALLLVEAQAIYAPSLFYEKIWAPPQYQALLRSILK